MNIFTATHAGDWEQAIRPDGQGLWLK